MSTRHWIYDVEPRQLYERFWREYEDEGWESSTRRLIETTLSPGDLFVDIGAWIGPVTLWALAQGAEVIAVEPDPVALAELKRKVPDEVEIWEGAVAVRSGRATLTTNHGLELGKSVSRLGSGGEVEVRTWTLPEILAGRVPALVKLDVEGYELDLLPSMAPYLAGIGVPLQVELHGAAPDPEWFAAYGHVEMPDDCSGQLRAWP